MKASLCLLIVALTMWASAASSQSIGIVADVSEYGVCAIPAVPGAGTAYIVLIPGGDATQATGAEFGTTGWPDWVTSVTANPRASVVIGDPLSSTGCHIAFPSGIGPAPVVLFTVSYVAPESPPNDIRLQVVGVPGQSCPRVTRDDAPSFTSVCAHGTPSWLNPAGWQAPELLSPADGAVDQPTSGVLLHWNWSIPADKACLPSAYDPAVYFGTDSDPPFVGFWNQPPFGHATGQLLPGTVYYWRISINGGGAGPSPVWHFRTGTQVGVVSRHWQQVKQLYR